MPPKKQIIHTVDAHPAIVLPSIAVMTAQIIPIPPIRLTRKPNPVIIEIGLIDKLVMPSKAK